ncbi:MAG: efflux RND transporter periplasmic adaptor subunit [Planctomycetaceae bacterium]
MPLAPTISAATTREPSTLTDFESALASGPSDRWLDRVAETARRSADLFSLGWFGADGQNTYSHYLPESEKSLEQVLSQIAEQSAAKRETVVMTAKPVAPASRLQQNFVLIAVNVTTGGLTPPRSPIGSQAHGVLAGAFLDHAALTSHNLNLLQSAAGAIRLHHGLSVTKQAEDELLAAAAVIDLVARLQACESQLAACQRLADDVAKYTKCRFVAVGLTSNNGRACRLAAVSDQAAVPPESDRRQAVEAALEEILVRDSLTVWPPESNTRRHGLLTHSRLCELLGVETVLGSPIQLADGTPVGAWLLCGGSELRDHVVHRRFVEAASQRLGAPLELIRRAERSTLQRLLKKFGASADSSQRRTLFLTAALGLACLTLPMTHEVACDCELQPVVRRFVAAPFEGTLEKSLVEPGETVVAGQLLARMDPREINWELAGVDAEQQRAAKERDTNLAKQDIGAAEISRYDIERLKTRRSLLTHRSEHLEIRSPINGLVITGDLKKSEGVPMKTGDRMFEIAPLDQMLVEVAIPEPEIRHIALDQEVSVVLDAFPGETLTGTLRRIHPRSEVRDESNVFIAEVELPNPQGRLRPGMKGSADINAGRRMLGWILFHRPIEAALLRLGW